VLRGGYPHKSPHYCEALFELLLFMVICKELNGVIKSFGQKKKGDISATLF
jgi:hypothetical protein